jgi:hypothetical protein
MPSWLSLNSGVLAEVVALVVAGLLRHNVLVQVVVADHRAFIAPIVQVN